jgi:hypothetical protein
MNKFKNYLSLLIVIFIFIIGSALCYFYFPYETKVNILVAFATFLVGVVAIYLYITQKRDYKRDTANIILMEIRNAENIIAGIKQGAPMNSKTILLPTNNWAKNNYLFINDLDGDELNAVNNFYNQCSIIDKSLSELDISIQLEQKANHIHNKLVEMAREITKGYSYALSVSELENLRNAFNIQKNNFLEIINKEGWSFSPDDPKREILRALDSIEKITTSSVGNKIKKIARVSH